MLIAAQWCSAFQIRLGDQMARATPAPAYVQGLVRARRRPDRTRPTARPTTKNATLYLFSSATPITAPIGSHRRGSAVRSSRSTSSVIADQKNRSNAAVDSRCMVARVWLEVAAATAARSWARRPPPSSRAMSPVNTTVAPPASAGKNRSATTRPAEQVGGEASDRGDDWRLVDVPPRQVAGAGEEVELVSVVPVPGGHCELERDERAGEREEQREVPARAVPRRRRRRGAGRPGRSCRWSSSARLDQGVADELDDGGANQLVVEGGRVSVVAAVPREPGDGLGDEARRHRRVGHGAQVPARRPPVEVAGEGGVVPSAGLLEVELLQIGQVGGGTLDDGQDRPESLDEVVALLDDPGELGANVGGVVTSRAARSRGVAAVRCRPRPISARVSSGAGVGSGSGGRPSANWPKAWANTR